MQINQIVHANMLEFTETLPENSIDLIIADGPYAVTNQYWDKIKSIQTYNLNLIKIFGKILKNGGSLYLFGKHDAIDFIDYSPFLKLNTRIIWYQPSRLAQGRNNFTDNYDVIYYFSKGKTDTFNLDDIRVPQLVELIHRKRCENVPSVKNGKFNKTRFNPNGKNPGNVWGDIKQLTYKSKELLDRKLLNTIQKPEKLMERLIKASSRPGDIVYDPFLGTGTSLKVAAELGRNVIGCESDEYMINTAYKRLKSVVKDLDINYEYSESLSDKSTIRA
ncbi:MAG: site-specific DNA-methyltransferase [Spirochaetia bacterium]|nr:site-specific DNA-methyltransferase [Spirochaetia bacterium]